MFDEEEVEVEVEGEEEEEEDRKGGGLWGLVAKAVKKAVKKAGRSEGDTRVVYRQPAPEPGLNAGTVGVVALGLGAGLALPSLLRTRKRGKR